VPELAPNLLRFSSETPPLSLVESLPSSADLLSQNSIFLNQIFDHVVLMLVDPTCYGYNQN
jgi:hypothetical protein